MVRVKRRYIVLKFINRNKQQKTNQDDFIKGLRERLASLYGDFGVACLNRGFSVKRYDQKDGIMILAVRRGVHEIVMSVLPLFDVTIVHLSGTVRGCLKYIKKDYIINLRAAIALKEQQRQLKNDNHRLLLARVEDEGEIRMET